MKKTFSKMKCPSCGSDAGWSGQSSKYIYHECGDCRREWRTKRPMTENNTEPKEVGGTHYQQGVRVSPWDLQKVMQTSGNAFVDARRADTIKYSFRMKGDAEKLLEDLKKAKHCLEAGIEELERHINKKR